MPTKLSILTTILLLAHVGLKNKVQAAEMKIRTEAASMHEKSPIEVEFRHSAVDGQLKIQYSIHNRSNKSVFLFDRLWNNQEQHIDPNWAYIKISGKTAVIKRSMETMPQGVRMDTPPVPYGREIAPGTSAAGTFDIRLPLTESGPYDRMLGRKPSHTISIDKITLEFGWCPKSDLEKDLDMLTPVKSGADTLWPFGYGQLIRVQRKAKSSSSPARLRARMLSPE